MKHEIGNHEIGNFEEHLHVADFEIQYKDKLIQNNVIADYYREKESLNGLWNYGIDQYETCLRAKWFEEKYFDDDGRPYPMDFSFDTWETMPVPSCWNLQVEKLFHYEGSIVFTRTFNYVNHGEKRVFIKFGGVNYKAFVFVNGQYMGVHLGGSTPFYIELSDILKNQNRIIVVANNTRKPTNIPCENTDWFNYGGIYRDVEIIRLPETFIQNFTLNLEPDSDFKKINATVSVNGISNKKSGTAKLCIKELNINVNIDVTDGFGSVTLDAPENLELWSPENPKLYDVEITYDNDSLTDTIGFREIITVGTDIFLNGKNIFLRGICAHEESVPNGKAVTEKEIRENFALAKEMNCNYMRLAHYPHCEKAARIADEVGIMLWEEIPVYWAIEFENPKVYNDAENQLIELIKRDQNRASVIIWSVGNENADTDARLSFMSSLAKTAKTLDKTRLVSAACLVDHKNLMIADRLVEHIDVIGLNEYYGWYEPDFSKLHKLFENSKPTKPVVISEFGADAKSGFRGTQDDMFTEDKQFEIFKKQIETLGKISYVKGTSPWILFDFRCPRRVNTAQNYYNLKGLLSADKTHKKLAFYVMQKFYSEKEE